MYIISDKNTMLGPFLTLLVLSALGRADGQHKVASRGPTQTDKQETARIDTFREPPGGQAEPALFHQTKVTLGPFMTLILTLHGQARSRCSECRLGPVVRLIPVSAVHGPR